MGKATLVARILLGLPFLVFGLNYFLEFMEPPPKDDAATAFLTGLGVGGFLWPIIKVVEITGGVMLITGRFVPLALTILAPVIVVIVAFHLVLAPDPQGLGMALAILALELFLAFAYRGNFKPMLRASAPPC